MSAILGAPIASLSSKNHCCLSWFLSVWALGVVRAGGFGLPAIGFTGADFVMSSVTVLLFGSVQSFA